MTKKRMVLRLRSLFRSSCMGARRSEGEGRVQCRRQQLAVPTWHRRPGVPTMTVGQSFFNSSWCDLMGKPPKKLATLTLGM